MTTFTETTLQKSPSNCVLFSLFYTGLEVNKSIISYYVDMLTEYFPEFDVYVGVNGKVDQWLSSKLSEFYVLEVSEETSINSDSAGYISALHLLKHSDKSYDTVWFLHTKGASHATVETSLPFREYVTEHYAKNKDGILQMFASDPKMGIIGHEPSIFAVPDHIDSAFKLKNDLKLQYNPIGFFYCGTHYVMSGSVVSEILKLLPMGFYTKNIYKLCGFDRFFFEGVFKSFPEMLGYDPHVLNYDSYMNGSFIEKEALKRINDWKSDRKNYTPKVWI